MRPFACIARPLTLAGLAAAVGCGGGPPPDQSPSPEYRRDTATEALNVAALAGREVAILPLTLVAADPALASQSVYAPYRDREPTLRWADSLIGSAFQGRGPEVQWVLPAELRKIARRAPGFVDDPDQMGQAMMRDSGLDEMPDQLRASLRSLMAIVGGREVMIPAALGFGTEPAGGVRADLSLVLADVRNGKVLWRTVAIGRGATPAAALEGALAAVLPLGISGP